MKSSASLLGISHTIIGHKGTYLVFAAIEGRKWGEDDLLSSTVFSDMDEFLAVAEKSMAVVPPPDKRMGGGGG